MSENEYFNSRTLSDKNNKKIQEIATKIINNNFISSSEDSELITSITINEIIEIAKFQGLLQKKSGEEYIFNNKKKLKSNNEVIEYFISTYEDLIIERRVNIVNIIKIEIKKMKNNKKMENKKTDTDLRLSMIKQREEDLEKDQQDEEDTKAKKMANLLEMSGINERVSKSILKKSKVSNNEIHEDRISNTALFEKIITINSDLGKSKNDIYQKQLEIASIDNKIDEAIREYYSAHDSDIISQLEKIYSEKKNLEAKKSIKILEELIDFTTKLGDTQTEGFKNITKNFTASTKAINKGFTGVSTSFTNGLNDVSNSMTSIGNQFYNLQVVIIENTLKSLEQKLTLSRITIRQEIDVRVKLRSQRFNSSIASAHEQFNTILLMRDVIGDARLQEAYERGYQLVEIARQADVRETEEINLFARQMDEMDAVSVRNIERVRDELARANIHKTTIETALSTKITDDRRQQQEQEQARIEQARIEKEADDKNQADEESRKKEEEDIKQLAKNQADEEKRKKEADEKEKIVQLRTITEQTEKKRQEVAILEEKRKKDEEEAKKKLAP